MEDLEHITVKSETHYIKDETRIGHPIVKYRIFSYETPLGTHRVHEPVFLRNEYVKNNGPMYDPTPKDLSDSSLDLQPAI